jgi:hypothetical protein
MKKIYIGILAILYLAVSSGIALELHYCMGDRAGVELYGSSSETCGKCGMTEKDTGCCHDDYKFYKLSDSHKTVSNDINFTADEKAVINHHFVYNWQMPYNTALTSNNIHSPPDYARPSASIMNCVFRL